MPCRYMLALVALVATPTMANEVGRTSQAFSGTEAIRSYDFLNARFYSPLADTLVKLDAGSAATGVSALSVQVVFGDLDGDDNEEAVVVWQDEGAVGGSSGGEVYRLQEGELTSVWKIPEASRIDGWLQKAMVEQGDLVLARAPEQSPNADYCDGAMLSRLYFAQGEFRVRQTYCDDGSDPSSPLLKATMPDELRAFVERREACDHFRGEPVEGEGEEALARLEFVQRQIFESCSGTDAELQRLRRAYADDPAFRKALAAFEYPIETAGERAGPDSEIDIAAEQTLQSGVYGPLVLGVDSANARFSGVYHASGQPECSLRLHGLMDRVDEPLRVAAQVHRDAHRNPEENIGVVSGRLVAGLDIKGTPTAWLRLDQIPQGCAALSGLSDAQAKPLPQTVSGEWISVHWTVTERAYFHTEPDASTARKAYVVSGDTLRGYGETAEFVELEFVAPSGRATKGWINWMDVMPSLWLGDGAEM